MRICVFCGSSDGFDPLFRAGAVSLGETLARHRLRAYTAPSLPKWIGAGER